MMDFLQTFHKIFIYVAGIPKSLKNDIINASRDVKPTIKRHIEWIKNLPMDSDKFAWALGPEMFDSLLELRGLPWDRKKILKIGNEIFNSSLKKLKQIANEGFPNKSLNEAIETFFKEDQVPSFQKALDYIRNEAKRAREFIIANNLLTIPEDKMKFVETPSYLTPIISGAAYEPVPFFNNQQPGIFMISQNSEQDLSYTQLSIWLVHEVYPGHHIDFLYNNNYCNPIKFLGFNDDLNIAYESVEGWALYGEEMMLKQQFFKDDLKAQQFISGMQVMRAIQIILDIQLHCKQRTITEATELLMNVLQVSESAAKAQILGYTSTPSYPLSYLIGKLLIEDLLKDLREKMGNDFSLKFFHDSLLRSGDLPYCLLKKYLEEKIKNF
jgi:uncharacterized protein (DUF885 family)